MQCQECEPRTASAEHVPVLLLLLHCHKGISEPQPNLCAAKEVPEEH